jgi:hypothetical protein
MLIQCLIKREGPTVQHIGGQRFEFKPRPELTGGDKVANVCEIQKDELVEYLLQNASFQQYVPVKKEKTDGKLHDGGSDPGHSTESGAAGKAKRNNNVPGRKLGAEFDQQAPAGTKI